MGGGKGRGGSSPNSGDVAFAESVVILLLVIPGLPIPESRREERMEADCRRAGVDRALSTTGLGIVQVDADE